MFVPAKTKLPAPLLVKIPFDTAPVIVEVTPLATDKVWGSVAKFIEEIELLLKDVKVKFLSVKDKLPDKVNTPLFDASPKELEF